MNLAVFGAGAWGTALAVHAQRLGHTVTLVPRRLEHALELALERENRPWLPGVALPPSLQIALEPGPVLLEAEAVLLACPNAHLGALCAGLAPHLPEARQLRLAVTLCKGLEAGTHRTAAEVAEARLPGLPAAVLSGPTHALEVAEGRPTAAVLSGPPAAAAAVGALQAALSGPRLRLYTSADRRGVELAGALKNVYAIAAGLCDGLRLGDNAKAALLTRSLAEMVRLGTALGGRPETFYGLGGFGDLTATCYGVWSRNRTFGEALAAGQTPADALAGRTVEGHAAARAFAELVREHALDAPILLELEAVLYAAKAPSAALAALMGRGLKPEG